MLPKQIKKARSKSGMTLKQLADKVGITESSMSRIESGSRTPDDVTTQKIKQFLGLQEIALTPEGSLVYFPTPEQWEKLESEEKTPQLLIEEFLNQRFYLEDYLALRDSLVDELQLMGVQPQEPAKNYVPFSFPKGEFKTATGGAIPVAIPSKPKQPRQLDIYSIVKTDKPTKFLSLWVSQIHNRDELDRFLNDLRKELNK
jgi:transcriptional regulator with XRE-family HTH domain